jgi:hypothetical protein
MTIISLLILVSVGRNIWAVALPTVGPNLGYDNRLNSKSVRSFLALTSDLPGQP